MLKDDLLAFIDSYSGRQFFLRDFGQAVFLISNQKGPLDRPDKYYEAFASIWIDALRTNGQSIEQVTYATHPDLVNFQPLPIERVREFVVKLSEEITGSPGTDEGLRLTTEEIASMVTNTMSRSKPGEFVLLPSNPHDQPRLAILAKKIVQKHVNTIKTLLSHRIVYLSEKDSNSVLLDNMIVTCLLKMLDMKRIPPFGVSDRSKGLLALSERFPGEDNLKDAKVLSQMAMSKALFDPIYPI